MIAQHLHREQPRHTLRHAMLVAPCLPRDGTCALRQERVQAQQQTFRVRPFFERHYTHPASRTPQPSVRLRAPLPAPHAHCHAADALPPRRRPPPSSPTFRHFKIVGAMRAYAPKIPAIRKRAAKGGSKV